ncbi:hypothetical protein [Thalassomonas haliotis]|uniref:Uncharacterized protein n=1 Tax=Thalassomonas haliotis TaxID=485448 RepID=A0ABY7VBT1_9GAMM|nr:hypothetical protein [Thalassomonas haliotis]WDE10781.1 hypothetical protein H3N35_21425 [Thalassomonas haliotis]
MAVKWLKATAVSLTLATSTQVFGEEFEFSGKVGMDARYFLENSQYNGQFDNSQFSVFAEPEFYWAWNNGDDSVIFKPYYRLDSQDDERSHGDIREFSYVHAGDDWELRTGIRKEFWGVTEFQHLVDVINQSDSIEDVDGEDKLGQLMVNLSLVEDWGIVDLYLLPGFRERTFASKDGRLRGPVVIKGDEAEYESSAGQQHLDFAVRWSHTLGDFDIGSYWFHGTNREPVFNVQLENGQTELTPYYQQMDQLGLDVQATIEDWLWKFESIYRHTETDNFWAAQAGFEYTYIGVMDTVADVGLLLEYGWDSRGEAGLSSTGAAMQNDLFIGSRLAFNDVQSSEILFGMGADLEHNAVSFVMEATRRFGEDYKVNLDIRLYQSKDPYDALYSIKDDDHLQLTVERYF